MGAAERPPSQDPEPDTPGLLRGDGDPAGPDSLCLLTAGLSAIENLRPPHRADHELISGRDQAEGRIAAVEGDRQLGYLRGRHVHGDQPLRGEHPQVELVSASTPVATPLRRRFPRTFVPVTEAQDEDAGEEDNERRKGRVAKATTPCAAAGLLDQRLEFFGALGGPRGCSGRGDGAIIPSTMLRVNVDRSEPLELHAQVAAEIRRAIAEGEATPGERLPPAKDLAAVIGVNKNTVLRALRLLRDEGLLEFRRGRGISVSGAPTESEVLAQARELVEFARTRGYRRDELIEIIERVA